MANAKTIRRRSAVLLVLILVLLMSLFAGAVSLTVLDAREMAARVQDDLDEQSARTSEQLAAWYADMVKQNARQLAAPFLWDVESLEGIREGDPEHERLQRRMWQFVYGKDERPEWEDAPVGPLESVLIIDRDHRILAASDPMVVDQRFTAPEQIARLEAALETPQLKVIEGEREDGRAVSELTVPVPNAEGEPMGLVRLRYVGDQIAAMPAPPRVEVTSDIKLWGPALAGILAVLGVGFGALATAQVLGLTRRLEAMAEGVPLPPSKGPGERALSLLEERLETLSSTVRRDDLLVASLTEALREGVVFFDPQGSIVANRLARRILGVESDADDAAMPRFRALLEANPELAAIVEAGVSGSEVVRDRLVDLQLPEGGMRSVLLTSYGIHDGSRTAGIVLLIKDDASIRTLERNLREASRLGAIARLTGSVAHEVKNPLGAIGIHLEHLRRRLRKLEEADPQAEERIAVIREEIGRLREILDEWLHLTSPEERQEFRASVPEALASAERLLRVEARHQGVELVVAVADDLPRVELSGARLRQVVLNLSLNALQAMPQGGRLTLRARGEGDWVGIEIADTGPGIPENVRDRIFELNFTTRPGGSGLGLPICRRIVEEAHGSMTFVTAVGAGTTFRVLLPSAESSRQRPTDQDLAQAGGWR
jgi:signal transduction histidine kinase